MTEALKRLIEAVERDRKVTIQTAHPMAKLRRPDEPARIMGYVEGYAVMRHKGAAPFVVSKKDVLAHLRAKLAEADNPTMRDDGAV